MSRIALACIGWMIIGFFGSTTIIGQDDRTSDRTDDRSSQSLDQLLFDDLKPAEREATSTPPSPIEPADANSNPTTDRGDSETVGNDRTVEKQLASRLMRKVSRQIRLGDVSDATLASQVEILRTLKQLAIESRKGARTSSTSGDTRSTDQGNGDGTAASGGRADGQADELGDDQMRSTDRRSLVERAWGHLPTTVRKEMSAVGSEEFLPGYDQIIQNYYQRINSDRNVRQRTRKPSRD